MTLQSSKSKELEDDADFEKDCPDNKQTHFYQFKEYDKVIALIDRLPVSINELRDKERSFEQFLFICDSYQEQPHLIDPFLQEIFDKLVSIIKKCIDQHAEIVKTEKDATAVQKRVEQNDELINEAFKYLYSLTKMRNFKKTIQYLPHEVNDFEPVLGLLARQNRQDVNLWQTRYMLLLWLSIVCMVPFDLNRFDSNSENQNENIMNRVLNICIPYLSATDKCQDASAFVLAKFMSRVDLKLTVLPKFFETLYGFIGEAVKESNNIKLLGALKCLCNIYKYGKREELLKYTLSTLKAVVDQDLLTSSHLSIVRKFHIKLVQRIGITFFKIKVAKWRYDRGSRVLQTEKGLAEVPSAKTDSSKTDETEEDDDDKVPGEIEEIIEQLLFGLKDRDTIVRWSSAKGIGRITNRLPKDMAEDVLTSVLDLFTFVEDDSAWHGGCLAIAELGRRGLLLPQQLPMVIPIVMRALIFDKKLGNYSLGRNVRDSACYVCWALARAFEPHIILPFVNQIASHLIIVFLFDREVNCRRAASAAFQENVGRQGQFPHGIDILTKCDYYAVGQIQNCYLNLSVFISEFEEYKHQIIDHLLEHKFNHWDQAVRELTSQALFNLTKTDPDYMASKIVPALLKHSFSIDLNTRHGALISLAEVIDALSKEATSLSASSEERLKLLERFFPASLIAELKEMLSKIFDAKYFRGSGAEFMRPAVCYFIKKLALSQLFNQTLPDEAHHQSPYRLEDKFMSELEEFLDQCLEYNHEKVQMSAVETVPFYCDLKFERSYETGAVNKKLVKESKLIETFARKLIPTSKQLMRSGYCLGIGSLPRYILLTNGNFVKAVDILVESCKIKPDYAVQIAKYLKDDSTEPIKGHIGTNGSVDCVNGWVQARKDSITALINLFDLIKTKQDFALFGADNQLLLSVFECLLNGLNDYTIDSKGDSGSKVREASIGALQVLLELCGKHDIVAVAGNEALLVKIFSGIIQQAVERIDRTRNIAGNAFSKILYNKHLKLDGFEFVLRIRQVFTSEVCKDIEWNVAHLTSPLFVRLLEIDAVQARLLNGLVFSMGSLTESLVKSVTMSVLRELQRLKNEKTADFRILMKRLLELTRSNISSERQSISIIKAVDLVIQNNLLDDEDLIKNGHLPMEFLNAFIDNVKVTKDMQKLIAYVDVFADMLQFVEDRVRERSMIQLMMMLCHQYPRIRKTTATKLFEALITYSEIIVNEEDIDECTSLLENTDWDQPLDTIRPIRNRLCDMTNTPKPVLKQKTQN